MGMLDVFKQGMAGLLTAPSNPGFGEGLAYIQARRAGVPAYKVLPELQQARSQRERDEIMKRQVAVDEREQQAREDEAKRKQSMVESQGAAARVLANMTPEQQSAYLRNPANMAWWFGPDADPNTSKAILGTITPQADEWVNIATRVGPDNNKYAKQQNKTTGEIREILVGPERAPVGTTVNVEDKGYLAARGKLQAQWESNLAENATAAMKRMDQLKRLRTVLSTIESGKFAPLGATIGKIAMAAGVDPQTLAEAGIDPNLAPSSEAITTITNKMVIANRSGPEGTMAGSMSDGDRLFLQDTVPRLRNTPAGNQIIMQVEESIAKREMDMYEAWIDYAGKAAASGQEPNRYAFEMLWMQKAKTMPLFPVITDPQVIDSLPPGTVYTTKDGVPTIKNVSPRINERDPELGQPWKKHQRKP